MNTVLFQRRGTSLKNLFSTQMQFLQLPTKAKGSILLLERLHTLSLQCFFNLQVVYININIPWNRKRYISLEKHTQGQAMHGNLECWFLFHSSLNLASYPQKVLRSIYPLINITSASWRTEKGRILTSCNSCLTAHQPDSTQSNDQGTSHLPKSPTLDIWPLKPLEQIHSTHSSHTQSLQLFAKW